jgi:hypothetical protein
MKISSNTRRTIGENAEALKLAKGVLETAVSEYNSAQEELRDTMQGALDELRGEFDEKSEKWQGSDKGEAASSWLEDIEAKIGDIGEDVDLDLPDPDDVTGFSDAPEE